MGGTNHFSQCSPLIMIGYSIRSIRVISVNRNKKNFSHNQANNTVAVRKLKNIIASELSSFNFNSSVRAELLFAIRYPNVVIKSLCARLDICLNYHANTYSKLRSSVRVIPVADRIQR